MSHDPRTCAACFRDLIVRGEVFFEQDGIHYRMAMETVEHGRDPRGTPWTLERFRPAGTDTWADPTGCWADVWDNDHEDYRPCEEEPDPASELGLCAEHEAAMARIEGR